jgi:prevent-host-death family protein
VPTVPATKFKAQCLELMDRVAEGRKTYVITKRGKPVAKLVPADPPRKTSIFGCMADRTEFIGDIEKPLWTDEQWKQFERDRIAQREAWEREWQTYGTISGKKTVGQPPHLAKAQAIRGQRREQRAGAGGRRGRRRSARTSSRSRRS